MGEPTNQIREVFPYLRLRNATAAIDFYVKVFNGKELFRLAEPSGRIGHAEVEIGGITLMLADEFPECNIVGPETLGGTTFSIHLHVDNCDELIQRMVDNGGTVLRPAQDQFYGERSGSVRDPFGHEWLIGHNIEQVSTDEMQRRYNELLTPKT